MKVLETKGITMPEAPLVWSAVAYARKMAPLRWDFDSQKAKAEKARAEQDHTQGKSGQPHWYRHQYDHATHEDAVEALVGEWLTVRGSDDLSTILTYMDQMDELKEALSILDVYDGGYFFEWLVLQGQSLFEAVLAAPELVDLMSHNSHNTFLPGLCQCLSRLLLGQSDIDTFLGYWWEYKEAGAMPDDFKGRLPIEVVKEWWHADETVE